MSNKMFFNDALEMMASDLGLDAEDLKEYAKEDKIGGWSGDGDNTKWPIGSLWEDEGRLLYALVRAMRPSVVVEMGIHRGCSSKHILAAMVKNQKGKLWSIDFALRNDYPVTAAQEKRWKRQGCEISAAQYPKNADIVFEDLMHDFPGTRQALIIAQDLNPQLTISHDGDHYLVGQNVRDAYLDVYGSCKSFSTEGSECGFAYWVADETE